MDIGGGCPDEGIPKLTTCIRYQKADLGSADHDSCISAGCTPKATGVDRLVMAECGSRVEHRPNPNHLDLFTASASPRVVSALDLTIDRVLLAQRHPGRQSTQIGYRGLAHRRTACSATLGRDQQDAGSHPHHPA